MAFLQRMRDTGEEYPPIGRFVQFQIDDISVGHLTGRGTPGDQHYNPLGVVHGGFASTLLDLALGHVSITALDDMTKAVSTTDLSVKYVRSIYSTIGTMFWESHVLHSGKSIVVAEALLKDADGKLYAMAQSTCMIVSRRDR